MKRFMIIMVLCFTSFIYGQNFSVDTLANGADTLIIKNLWDDYNVTLTIENLGTGEDTLEVSYYLFLLNSAGSIVDTLKAIPETKDYSGTGVIELIVPQGAIRSFNIQRKISFIEVALVTLSAAGNSRVVIEYYK